MEKVNINEIIIRLTLATLTLLCIFLYIVDFNQRQEIINLENEYIEYKINSEERIKILIEKKEELENKIIELKKETVKEEINYLEPFKETNKEQYMIEYAKILNENEQKLEIYKEYTKDEIDIMCRCIETETYQCPFEAKVNVANVIFNRIKSDIFPDDAVSVITAVNQFAYHRTSISEDTILALEYAYLNEDTTNGAIAFRSDSQQSHWGQWQLCNNDGYHCFYK